MSKKSIESRIEETKASADDLLQLLCVGELREYKRLDERLSEASRQEIREKIEHDFSRPQADPEQSVDEAIRFISAYFKGDEEAASDYLSFEFIRKEAGHVLNAICLQADLEANEAELRQANESYNPHTKDECRSYCQNHMDALEQLLVGHAEMPAYLATIAVNGYSNAIRLKLGVRLALVQDSPG